MDTITVPWMVEIGIISFRSVKRKQRPPLPSELLATFLVFGTFALISTRQPRVGSALGWGIVVATTLDLFGTQERLTNPLQKNTEKGPSK